jgi:hypothetical protein
MCHNAAAGKNIMLFPYASAQLGLICRVEGGAEGGAGARTYGPAWCDPDVVQLKGRRKQLVQVRHHHVTPHMCALLLCHTAWRCLSIMSHRLEVRYGCVTPLEVALPLCHTAWRCVTIMHTAWRYITTMAQCLEVRYRYLTSLTLTKLPELYDD